MKKLIYFALAFLSVFSVVLALHIYDVTNPDDKSNLRQLARIDISDDISETEALRLRASINAVDGVSHAYINRDSKRLIFSFNPNTHHSEKIVGELSQNTTHELNLYQPSAEKAAAGCPAIMDGSLSDRIASWFN